MVSQRDEVVAARGKVRLGTWMIIAGSLGAVMAVLTYIDVWDASDNRPTAWAFAAAACSALALGGFVVLWGGMTAGARARADQGRSTTSASE